MRILSTRPALTTTLDVPRPHDEQHCGAIGDSPDLRREGEQYSSAVLNAGAVRARAEDDTRNGYDYDR